MTLTTVREEALVVPHHEAHRHRGIMDQVDEYVDDEALHFLPPIKFVRINADSVGILVFEFTFEENPKNLYVKSL